MNIDDELEDLPGVSASSTSYAKQECMVTYDPTQIKPALFRHAIEKLGYKVI